MTNIRELPELSASNEIRTSEDWIEALAVLDPDDNTPIALDGIAFSLSVRDSLASPWIVFSASTGDGTLKILMAGANVAVVSGGAAYAVNDTITLPDGLVLIVSGIGASGLLTAASIKTPGLFSSIPANPVSAVSTSGSGSGATFNLTFVNNALAIMISASSIRLLPAGSYLYEIRATADGYTQTFISGALTVDAGVAN